MSCPGWLPVRASCHVRGVAFLDVSRKVVCQTQRSSSGRHPIGSGRCSASGVAMMRVQSRHARGAKFCVRSAMSAYRCDC